MPNFLRLINGVAKTVSYTPSSYSQQTTAGSDITSGTPVTLPASGTYTSDDLKVYVDGKRNYSVEDYTYVGSPPRTQIEFTYTIKAGSIILFETIT